MLTQHHPRELRAIKTRFDLLVRTVGGLQAASAALNNYPTSRLSEAASVNVADRWPRVDHVAELEALAQRPLVTAHLAALAGFGLAAHAPAPGCPQASLLHVIQAAGEMVASVAAALADGRVTPAERAQLGPVLDAVEVRLVRARAALAAGAA